MSNTRLLPPFWHILKAYQQDAIRLEFPIYIFVGKDADQEAYAQKKWGTYCTYLPNGEHISRYEWPIQGQKVFLYNTGGVPMPELKKMVLALIKFHPRQVLIFDEHHDVQIFNF